MGRPPKFSREQVQQAALTVLDRDGAGGLSMRVVAAELGTGPMTLYGHVRDRADLEVLVIDAVLAEVPAPVTSATVGRDIEEFCVAIWKAVRSHPHATTLIAARRGGSGRALDLGEALAGTLQRAGLSGDRLIVAFRALFAVVLGGVEADPATAGADRFEEPFGRLLGETATHPVLAGMVRRAAGSSPEELFRATLRVVLAGLAIDPGVSARRRRTARGSGRERAD
jgi:AcrR family transcriptional regulator